MAPRYKRIRTNKYRSFQRYQAAALVPTAFLGMFTTAPQSQVTLAARGQAPFMRVPLDELLPGCPMYRWNRGKYNRHPDQSLLAKTNSRGMFLELGTVAASIFFLALTFAWAGVH